VSTILKALRRLDHDRSVRSERPLRQEVASESEARPRSRRWPLLVAAVVCGIAAGPMALVVWTELLPRTGSSEPLTAAPAPSIASEAPDVVSDMASETTLAAASLPSETLEALPLPEPPAPIVPDPPAPQESVAEAPPLPIFSPDVETVQRPVPGPRIAAVPGDAPTSPAGPRPGSIRPYSSRQRSAVVERPPVSTAPAPAPVASLPSPTGVAAATQDAWEIGSAAAPDSVSDAALPRGDHASAALIPALRVESTEWHPSAQRRVAVVALEGADAPLRLQEGDVVGALVVGEIQPSGVIFYHEGIELRRRVGESP
jgi:hypothetical protein